MQLCCWYVLYTSDVSCPAVMQVTGTGACLTAVLLRSGHALQRACIPLQPCLSPVASVLCGTKCVAGCLDVYYSTPTLLLALAGGSHQPCPVTVPAAHMFLPPRERCAVSTLRDPCRKPATMARSPEFYCTTSLCVTCGVPAAHMFVKTGPVGRPVHVTYGLGAKPRDSNLAPDVLLGVTCLLGLPP